MNVLPTGTDDITSLSGITIGAVTSLTLAIPSYVNQAVSYIKGTTTTASIYYQSVTQSFSLAEASITKFVINRFNWFYYKWGIYKRKVKQ